MFVRMGIVVVPRGRRFVERVVSSCCLTLRTAAFVVAFATMVNFASRGVVYVVPTVRVVGILALICCAPTSTVGHATILAKAMNLAIMVLVCPTVWLRRRRRVMVVVTIRRVVHSTVVVVARCVGLVRYVTTGHVCVALGRSYVGMLVSMCRMLWSIVVHVTTVVARARFVRMGSV